MSRGKYSPTMYGSNFDGPYTFNAKGEPPENREGDEPWDEEIMGWGYDSEGFDSYGYSAYDADGNYIGLGMGVDRNGITEYEYMTMADYEFERYL